MIKAKDVDTTNVNDEMVGRAHKVFGADNKAFYMVQSSRDETVEYKVTHDVKTGFSCDCPAGKIGFSRCKAGVCQHVQIACRAAAEEREAVTELRRLIAEQAAKPVTAPVIDAETLQRVHAAKPAPTGKAKAPVSKAFSILR